MWRVVACTLFCGWACLAPAVFARAENEGLDDLDRATQLKVTAEGISDLTEAIDLLETALEKGLDEQNTAFAERLLVASLLQRATAFSSAVVERPPTDARQRVRWMHLRQFAMNDLQRAVSIDDQLWEAHLMIGRLQAMPGGDPRAARREFSKVIDAPDLDVEQRAEAVALRGTVQEDDAKRLEDFNRAIELAGDKADFLRMRSQHYFSKDQFEQALADIDRAIELEPDHAASHEMRGMILLGLERYDDALESFNSASALAPQAALPYQHRAELYRRQGDLENAVNQLTKALELSPNNAATLLLRAAIYYELEKLDLAIADVEQLIRIQPQLLQAHLMRAELYASTDRLDQAIEQLERLARAAPTQVEVLNKLAIYYLADSRPRKAIEVFTQLVDLDAGDYRALRNRGDTYLNVGEHAKAVADFDAALLIDGEESGLLNNLAWVLATSPIDEIRDGPRAVELAEKAADLTAHQMPHILSTLAAAYAETGDFDTAISWSEKAVELGADDATHEQLTQELASYRSHKPWREMQHADSAAGKQSSGEEAFAPASAPPAPARTADF